MTTEDRLQAEIKLLHAIVNCQADIIKNQRAEMNAIKSMVIEALAA